MEKLADISRAGKCYRVQSAIEVGAGVNDVWTTATQSATVGWWFSPGTIESEGGRIQLNYPDGRFGMLLHQEGQFFSTSPIGLKQTFTA